MTVDELIDGWQAAWSGKDPAAFADVCAAGIQFDHIVGLDVRDREGGRIVIGNDTRH